MTAIEVVVHGRVQGVFFRASTRTFARRTGVRGWVRNDASGTVTMHLEGADNDVRTVVAWVRAGGPEHAHVDRVDTSPTEHGDHDGFRIRH